MSTIDLAKRLYDHTWKLDPIVRSLLDTDFYKLLMLQMIWGLYPDIRVTFSLVNRSKNVYLAEEIDETELRDQLDHARRPADQQERDDLAGRQQLLRPGPIFSSRPFWPGWRIISCRPTSCAGKTASLS